MDSDLLSAMQLRADPAGRLACADALALSTALGVAPFQVGVVADAAQIKIVRCELGLFGPRRLDDGDDEGDTELVRRRLDALASTDLPCATAWDIARELGVPVLSVGRAATVLNLHICQCQLGCF